MASKKILTDLLIAGQLKLSTYTGTTQDGTFSSLLGVNSSGDVVTQTATDFLTSVPTLSTLR